MIIVGSVPVKDERDAEKKIKKLWKEFGGKVNLELDETNNLLIYRHYFSYKDLDNQIIEEVDRNESKGA